MKFEIKKVWIKNFFSVGAQGLEIDFTTGLHSVVGKVIGQDTSNGVGKSQAFIDSIVFALYGTSIRNLNLDGMVNKINQEECEVFLWFNIDNKPYRIERGIKPGFLHLVDEEQENNTDDDKEEMKEGRKKETQSRINDLLGISYTTFINNITLNINYSKPFFKLNPAEKREIFEDILNLSVFGKILEKVRKDYNENKHLLKNISTELSGAEELSANKKQTKQKIDQYHKTFEDNKQKELDLLQKEKAVIEANLNELKSHNIKDLTELRVKGETWIQEKNKKFNEINFEIKENRKKISLLDIKINRLSLTPICPECNSPTTGDHAQKHIHEMQQEMEKIESENKKLSTESTNMMLSIEEGKNKLSNIIKTIDNNRKIIEKIKIIENNLFHINEKIHKCIDKKLDIEQVITDEDIKNVENRVSVKKHEYKTCEKELKYSELLKDVVGDKGIKNYIIKKIMPLLNKKMNEYLGMFKASYTVHFDEEFNEYFKLNRRDTYTYNNFSAGEQKRIDLAFMFSLFAIAKSQNSLDCNILILDEICDSSMCSNGISSLMFFLKNDFKKLYPNLCTYIITHKTEIDKNDFNTVIKLKKENGFTKLDEIEKINQVLQV